MLVHFNIFNVKHNPPKIVKYIVEESFFYFYGVSECERKCVSWSWKFVNLVLECFGKAWKYV